MTIDTFRSQMHDGSNPYRALCSLSPEDATLRGPFWPIWD